MFDDIEKQLEEKAIVTNEIDQIEVDEFAKEERWLQKRLGRITASTLPDLMKKGRGTDWGETAKKVLYPVKYERRTKLLRQSNNSVFNFKFGHENEPRAIEWLKRNGYKITHSDDCEDIIFNTPFDGFGDSPDFIGDKLVGEIKCHVDQGKIEAYREMTEITHKHENYWQFIGHFIGMPEAETLLFVSYDAYADSAHLIEMKREEHEENIEKCIERIKFANEYINSNNPINELK